MVKSDDQYDPLDYTINNTNVTVTIMYSMYEDIVIPEKVKINGIEYTVTAIGNNVFKQTDIKSIKIQV